MNYLMKKVKLILSIVLLVCFTNGAYSQTEAPDP